MKRTFRESLMSDLQDSFLNEREFGEIGTLGRGGESRTLRVLYDEPSLDGVSLGVELEAVAHRPRAFVSVADLPGGVPKKKDVLILGKTEFHGKKKLVAKDFTFERDGTVVYELADMK